MTRFDAALDSRRLRSAEAMTAMRDAADKLQRLPIFLKVDEVAALLRTTRTAIYAMTARGQLPGVTRIGRRLLFRREALLQWLDQNRAPSPKE